MWILRASGAEADDTLVFRLLPGHTKTAGRATQSDFVMDAPLVSRVHCRFSVSTDGSVEVRDLDSTNGTWVNGERIQQSALSAGAVVRIGRVELTLERDDQS